MRTESTTTHSNRVSGQHLCDAPCPFASGSVSAWRINRILLSAAHIAFGVAVTALVIIPGDSFTLVTLRGLVGCFYSFRQAAGACCVSFVEGAAAKHGI